MSYGSSGNSGSGDRQLVAAAADEPAASSSSWGLASVELERRRSNSIDQLNQSNITNRRVELFEQLSNSTALAESEHCDSSSLQTARWAKRWTKRKPSSERTSGSRETDAASEGKVKQLRANSIKPADSCHIAPRTGECFLRGENKRDGQANELDPRPKGGNNSSASSMLTEPNHDPKAHDSRHSANNKDAEVYEVGESSDANNSSLLVACCAKTAPRLEHPPVKSQAAKRTAAQRDANAPAEAEVAGDELTEKLNNNHQPLEGPHHNEDNKLEACDVADDNNKAATTTTTRDKPPSGKLVVCAVSASGGLAECATSSSSSLSLAASSARCRQSSSSDCWPEVAIARVLESPQSRSISSSDIRLEINFTCDSGAGQDIKFSTLKQQASSPSGNHPTAGAGGGEKRDESSSARRKRKGLARQVSRLGKSVYQRLKWTLGDQPVADSRQQVSSGLVVSKSVPPASKQSQEPVTRSSRVPSAICEQSASDSALRGTLRSSSTPALEARATLAPARESLAASEKSAEVTITVRRSSSRTQSSDLYYCSSFKELATSTHQADDAANNQAEVEWPSQQQQQQQQHHEKATSNSPIAKAKQLLVKMFRDKSRSSQQLNHQSINNSPPSTAPISSSKQFSGHEQLEASSLINLSSRNSQLSGSSQIYTARMEHQYPQTGRKYSFCNSLGVIFVAMTP